MSIFNSPQLQDLRDLQAACESRGAEIAIIGAMAYRCFIDDINRETLDIDLAVAVDPENLDAFYEMLTSLGWTRVPRHEQRWRTARGALMDILPAGPSLRARGRLDWPESGLSMSLAGFDHVFRDSTTVPLAPDLRCKVVPPPVLLLLKMGSYLDDPYRREKDLFDVRRLFRRYAHGTDRVFSDEVFEADLPDIEFAGAFLLARDVALLATAADYALIDRFFDMVETRLEEPPALDIEGRDTLRFHEDVEAFRKGLRSKRT